MEEELARMAEELPGDEQGLYWPLLLDYGKSQAAARKAWCARARSTLENQLGYVPQD